MLDGKKSVAEGSVYGALESVETRMKREPIGVFHDALNNVKPGIEARSRRVSGATYQVPVEVRPERAQALAIRWLITAASHGKLLNGLVDAFFLSPIFLTASHPGAPTLGAARANTLAQQSRTPAYALGGITPSNARILQGFVGIAAIGALDVQHGV
jgi:hypothetical protein